jgi:hypothetical protein
MWRTLIRSPFGYESCLRWLFAAMKAPREGSRSFRPLRCFFGRRIGYSVSLHTFHVVLLRLDLLFDFSGLFSSVQLQAFGRLCNFHLASANDQRGDCPCHQYSIESLFAGGGGSREAGSVGRLLHQAQAVPQRRLLLGPHLPVSSTCWIAASHLLPGGPSFFRDALFSLLKPRV